MNVEGLLKDVATWWSVTPNGLGGDLFGTPVPVKCRWEDRTETYIGQIDRRELVSNAVVFTDRDVSTGDYLVKGDSSLEPDPTTVAKAFKIQRFDKVSDLRNLSTVRRAVL